MLGNTVHLMFQEVLDATQGVSDIISQVIRFVYNLHYCLSVKLMPSMKINYIKIMIIKILLY